MTIPREQQECLTFRAVVITVSSCVLFQSRRWRNVCVLVAIAGEMKRTGRVKRERVGLSVV